MSIAVSFLALTKRSATFRRNILILARVSLRTPPVGVPIDGLDALSASFLVIRPSLPVPTTVDAGISRSANILRAAGATRTGGVGCAGEVTCTGEGAEAAGAAGTSCFTGCDVEGAADEAAVGAFASVSIKHTTCPTFTASPSSACNVIIPLASAGSSRVALSESTSATAWSLVT